MPVGAPAAGSEGAFVASWEPRGYLLKKSPAAGTSLLKKLGWQRRYFVIDGGEFCWYASAKAAAKGTEPLGRVPLPMILNATASASGAGSFEVDLGNRQLQLCLDGVPKPWLRAGVQCWIDALIQHEVLEEQQSGKDSHRGKFWKERRAKRF